MEVPAPLTWIRNHLVRLAQSSFLLRWGETIAIDAFSRSGPFPQAAVL